MVPPSTSNAVAIVEALLAAEQGVKNITVGYGQCGNVIQDVAAIRALEEQTKEYLDDCGAKYDCIFVDKLEGEERKQIIEAIKKVNPKLSFPTLLVDEEAIVGFKQDQIKEALER